MEAEKWASDSFWYWYEDFPLYYDQKYAGEPDEGSDYRIDSAECV